MIHDEYTIEQVGERLGQVLHHGAATAVVHSFLPV
ncbi:hypothetical protein C8D88_102862 [Lentzea atacamensis]|uniref:Uncharacterized protein n=1 Tax=Lentzea atacamensis TaxID=531938 RepID=A0A316I839_9PSEU|nr:hypothetical protein C8D88_102862 [Lentzea atacamensis]RAS60633.1 hypothetical protein C8D87_11151 [Lentzea atacamensis]